MEESLCCMYIIFFEHYGEEMKAEDLQGLKPFGIDDCYIAETDDIVIEGKSPRISPLQDFVSDYGYFDNCDILELDIMLLDRKIEVLKARAIELLCDDLRVDGDYQYSSRIFDAENPAEEIEKIIRELSLVIVGMIIDNLNDEYKRIEEDNFMWV